MDEKTINDETMQRFLKVADLVDQHKEGYDLKFYEAVSLYHYFQQTKDVMELIRIAFNVGFYQGIGYQIDYAKKVAEEKEREEQEHREQRAKKNEQALISSLMKAKTEAEIKKIVNDFSLDKKDTEIASLTSSLMRATSEAERKGVIYAFMGIEIKQESKPKRGRKKSA